jgi:hypothetical protein
VVATGWLGQTGRWDGSGRRKAPNRAGERDNGEATGQAVAGGDRVASPVTGARKALTSGTRLPERERDRERARGVRLTGGAELAVAEGRGARVRGDGPRKGGVRARGRVRGGLGRKRLNRGGGVFPFLFLFLISYFYFSFLFLLSPFLLNN